MNFIKWLKASMEGNDGLASGKAITAFIFVILICIITFYCIWFAIYSLMRQSLISENELSAAHYPIEVMIILASSVLGLWGVGALNNVFTTKFTQPKSDTNVNQPEKVIVNP